MSDCIFCKIIAGEAPATRLVDHGPVVSFVPLGPQAPGHVLFVPKAHVPDAAAEPITAARVMQSAARYVQRLGTPANIITSIGAEATQSVFHLHIHVLPRGAEDGLRPSWPWVKTIQKGEQA